MNARRLALLLAVALLAVTAKGCTSLKQKLAPKPKVITRKAVIANVSASVEGTVAAGMPDNVPLWPGAKVIECASDKGSYEITLRTDAPYDAVLAGVAEGFKESGWDVQQDEASDGGLMSATLTVTAKDAQGFITIADSAEATDSVDIAYVLTK